MRAASGEQAKKRLLYTPPASGAITDYEELVQEETTVQYKEASLYQEPTIPAVKSSITMQDVIYFLQTVGSSNIKVTGLENENTRLKQEIKSQILRNEELEKKLEKLEQQSHTVQEDYETLMNIMNRARKLAVMDDEERSQTSFRMDRNGNLEKLQNKKDACNASFLLFHFKHTRFFYFKISLYIWENSFHHFLL
ncbi:hypothetical protein AAHB52_04790 [Bacillus toyonensis]